MGQRRDGEGALLLLLPGLLEFDCVVFHHPHSGREDVQYHRRLLSHLLPLCRRRHSPLLAALLSLCDRQPWQWQLQQRAEQQGWQLLEMGGWEAERDEWAALGYESKRHHSGRQFNSRHVTHRHKLTLARAGTDAQLALLPWRHRFPLLLRAALAYSDEQRSQLGWSNDGGDEAEEAAVGGSEPAGAQCPICRQCHSEQASRVQPRAAEEGKVRCERCHVTFTNQRALQQHAAAMDGRDDHIALVEGEASALDTASSDKRASSQRR